MIELPIAISAIALLLALWALFYSSKSREIAQRAYLTLQDDKKPRIERALNIESSDGADSMLVLSVQNAGYRPVRIERSYFILPGGRELPDTKLENIGSEYPIDLNPGVKSARIFRAGDFARFLKEQFHISDEIQMSGVIVNKEGRMFVTPPISFNVDRYLRDDF